MAIRNRVLLVSIGIAALWAAAPAQAQTEADLDRLVDASQGVGPAIKLARQQIADDDLIGAVGTLERLLVDHPEADDALLLHLSLLCRLDDGAGARVEMGELSNVKGSDAVWAEVRAACGPVPRPTGRN